VSRAPALQFENYVEGSRSSNLLRYINHRRGSFKPLAKKPPRPVGEVHFAWEIAKKEVPAERPPKCLDEAYVIEDRPPVSRFMEEHR
jgi:hypothetical protein